jgi:voltage-gated potassium channel Kch
VFGLAIGIIVVKSVLIAGLAFMFGMRKGRAIWLGLLLSQAGEFGFVLFGQAASAQLITTEAASLFSAVVTLTMVSTPFLMQVIEWILRRLPEPAVDLDGPEFSPETNAIVVGYGRFGQTVAQMLMAKRIPVTIIDSKPSQIELSEEFGTKVYYGDGTRGDLLRTAGAESAEAIIFCQNPRELTRDKLEAVFEAFPHAAIMVRVYDRLQVIEFDGLDLSVCQRELYESAVVMGREVLIKLGVSRREAERVEREYRERDLERLEAQTITGDLHAKSDRSFSIDRPLPDEAVDPA